MPSLAAFTAFAGLPHCLVSFATRPASGASIPIRDTTLFDIST
jgi:hypothetical protein